MADHRALWTIGVGVIAAVLIALAGLEHSHTKTALALAAIGVVASWFVAYSVGVEREKRRDDYPVVHLADAHGAVFTPTPGEHTVVRLQLRARNSHQATVLTDWKAVLTLLGTSYVGSHRFADSFIQGMANQTLLDQATASTPLHGEVTGWISFVFPVETKHLTAHLDEGLLAIIRVSVQDFQEKVATVEIDLVDGWQEHHQDFPNP